MDSQQPVFSFIGDINGALAQQMQGHVRLTAYADQAAIGQHGLVIDGTTAPALDPNVAGKVLDSGGLLAVCNPTAEHTAILGRLAGQTPAAGVPMVCFKQTSSAPPRYKCVTVTGNQIKSRARCDGDEPVETTASQLPELGPILAAAALDTTPFRMAPSGFVPPQGTYCGYQSQITDASWSPGYPNWGQGPDDVTAGGTSQNITGQFLTEFFIYWANGVTSNPYYVVIQKQSGPMSIGNVLANNQDSRGFFNLGWKASSTGVSINGTPNPAGVALGPHAPGSSENNGSLPVILNVPIEIVGPTQSGTGNIVFTAAVADGLDYSQWGIQDQTGTNTAWEGYQTLGWNPLQNPTWDQLYTNGNVVTMSDQAFGAVDFETFTSWTFDSSLFTIPSGGNPFTPPPSLWVTFNFYYEQDLAFLHNHPGCKGQHFHIWEIDAWWSGSITFDLGSVASQQGLGPS